MKKILICLISMLCVGCAYSTISSVEKPTSIPTKINERDTNSQLSKAPLTDFSNMSAVFTDQRAFIPAQKGDGIYQVGTLIQYSDPSISDHFAPVCTMPGCKHNDVTCHSYIGNAEVFVPYNGVWYYSMKDDKDQYKIIEHDPVTNTRTPIAQYERKDDASIIEYINQMVLSHGVLYVHVTRNELIENSLNTKQTKYIDCIDLNTKKKKILDGAEYNDTVVAGNGSHLILMRSQTRSTVSGGVEAIFELRLLNLETQAYQIISNTESGLHSMHDFFQLTHHDDFVYVANDEIHLFNMSNQHDEVIYRSNHEILSAWFFGENIRFLERDADNENLMESMINPQTQQKEDFPNFIDPKIGITRFSPTYVTEHGQIGKWYENHGLIYGWMLESDYLNSRFNQMVQSQS